MEQVPVLFDEKPQIAPETAAMKSAYSRAGLSTAALYGTIGVGQSAAFTLMAAFTVVWLLSHALPEFSAQTLLQNPGVLLNYFKNNGFVALLLTVFLAVQAGAWIVGFVIMRLVLPEAKPIEKHSLSFGRFLMIALMCFGVWGVGAALGNLSAFFGVETESLFSEELLGRAMIPYLVYAVVGAPIVEELTFRKALLDGLHGTHEGYAAVISGLLFGLMHGNHMQFFLAFFLGMLFAMVYQRTGRILYTMLLHAMINFTASLPEILSLVNVDIDLVWNIVIGALIAAGLVVLIVKRRDPLLHAAPCTVPDANNAVYRNVGMRIVRIAALVMIGVQGTILILGEMFMTDVDHWGLALIFAIPLSLVFLTVFLLPVFTKCYEANAADRKPMDCMEEAGL